jgi:Protein of unknown function (DUF3995)
MILLVLAVPLALILVSAAALHFYWAAGGLWPGRSPRELIDTVIGDPRLDRMPPAWAGALVGLALAGTALIPLVLALPLWGKFLPDALTFRLFLWSLSYTPLVALVFIARGVAGYLPFWRRRLPAQPFARLDMFLYSPLCLFLGLGLLLLDFAVAIAI